MKSVIFCLSFVCAVATANGQVYKTYLKGDEEVSEVSRADSYVLISQIADSAWLMKQYTINDIIMSSGTFKDRSLSIPHGKFVYYHKSFYIPVSQQKDTANYVQTVGYFENGKRTGTWTEFFNNKLKSFVKTYKNDVLDGPYESYNIDNYTLFSRGNYMNDFREGDWDLLDKHGNIVRTDVYKDGKVVESKTTPSFYVAPEQSKAFLPFIYRTVNNYVSADTRGDISIICKLSPEGKLTEPKKMRGTGLNPELEKKILAIVTTGPDWKPAYDKNLKHNIEDSVFFSLKIADGTLEVRVYSIPAKASFYQYTH